MVLMFNTLTDPYKVKTVVGNFDHNWELYENGQTLAIIYIFWPYLTKYFTFLISNSAFMLTLVRLALVYIIIEVIPKVFL